MVSRALLAVAIAGLALAASCAEKPRPAPIVRPVRVRPVEVAPPGSGTRYTANVEPLIRVDLAFKRGGYIGEVLTVAGEGGKPRLVQDGDTVRKGQVLCRIREDDYRVKVAQAHAALVQAEAALDQARQDLDRAKPLADEKAIPQTLFDGARNKYEGTKGAVDLYRATVREAELALDDTALRAPIDATVMKRLVEVGSLVGPGVGGFVLADVTSVKVVFGIPDAALAAFPMGARVPATVAAVGAAVEGRVTRVSPYADPRTRLFDIEVTIDNADGRLKPGMIASVSAPAGSGEGVPTVPLEAVRRPAGATEGYAVVVVEGVGSPATARVRGVRIGDVRGSRVMVTDGLKAGDRVVVSGAALVADGETVAIVP
jgi:multidrug efflux system membrane fusion protein